jgi:hypothetical protein
MGFFFLHLPQIVVVVPTFGGEGGVAGACTGIYIDSHFV